MFLVHVSRMLVILRSSCFKHHIDFASRWCLLQLTSPLFVSIHGKRRCRTPPSHISRVTNCWEVWSTYPGSGEHAGGVAQVSRRPADLCTACPCTHQGEGAHTPCSRRSGVHRSSSKSSHTPMPPYVRDSTPAPVGMRRAGAHEEPFPTCLGSRCLRVIHCFASWGLNQSILSKQAPLSKVSADEELHQSGDSKL